MKFSIITPTYRRKDMLARAIASVQAQTYSDWEMIIINDSPDDTSYQSDGAYTQDSRIIYYTNETNRGINYSRNRGIDSISTSSEWVIFLDDDDYLAPDALARLRDTILTHPSDSWIVTNRAHTGGKPITKAPRSDTHYSYAWNYLLKRNFTGDATHCISVRTLKNIRFSKRVRQAEEWIFYFELDCVTPFFYHDYNTTISDGYSATGLNFRKRKMADQIKTLTLLWQDAFERGFAFRPLFIAYMAVRCVRVFIR